MPVRRRHQLAPAAAALRRGQRRRSLRVARHRRGRRTCPAVGENLQDHLEVYVQYGCKQPVSVAPALKWRNRPLIGAAWLFLRRGPGRDQPLRGRRLRAQQRRRRLPEPDVPLPARSRSATTARRRRGHGYQVHVGPMYSDARGTVKITSTDPSEHPALRFNYLSTDQDRREWIGGRSRVARTILNQPAFDAVQRRRALARAGGGRPTRRSLTGSAADAETALHPSCTCRPWAPARTAVIDPTTMRVHGLDGLRVVDASVHAATSPTATFRCTGDDDRRSSGGGPHPRRKHRRRPCPPRVAASRRRAAAAPEENPPAKGKHRVKRGIYLPPFGDFASPAAHAVIRPPPPSKPHGDGFFIWDRDVRPARHGRGRGLDDPARDRDVHRQHPPRRAGDAAGPQAAVGGRRVTCYDRPAVRRATTLVAGTRRRRLEGIQRVRRGDPRPGLGANCSTSRCRPAPTSDRERGRLQRQSLHHRFWSGTANPSPGPCSRLVRGPVWPNCKHAGAGSPAVQGASRSSQARPSARHRRRTADLQLAMRCGQELTDLGAPPVPRRGCSLLFDAADPAERPGVAQAMAAAGATRLLGGLRSRAERRRGGRRSWRPDRRYARRKERASCTLGE